MHSGYGERAETYLRILAETALRHAPNGDTGRVGRAAEILVDADVLTDQLAAEILADFQVALRARGVREAFTAGSRLRRLRSLPAGGLFSRRGVQPEPWRVLPLGPAPPGSRLMSLIRTADRALAPAVLHFSPAPIAPFGTDVAPLTTLTATDDQGTGYRLGFPDGMWAGSTWTGTIALHPAPPPAATRLVIIGPNGPVLRADLTAPPAALAAPVVGVGPAAESPGERLFTRRAEGLLATLARAIPDGPGPRMPDTREFAAILEAAGALSPLSAAPARLAALGRQLGLAAEGPASEVPARWTALVAYYGRRRRPAPATGTAAIGVVLPEIDGARFAVAGLHSGAPGTFLHVVAGGLRALPRHPLPGRPGIPPGIPPGGALRPPVPVDSGFSWWARDDAGGWHLAAIEDVNPVGGWEGLLRMALLPPLGHPTTTLALEVSGPSQQVTATLPLRW